MDANEILEIVKAFFNAILAVFKELKELFNAADTDGEDK